jgi:hypothetical protein
LLGVKDSLWLGLPPKCPESFGLKIIPERGGCESSGVKMALTISFPIHRENWCMGLTGSFGSYLGPWTLFLKIKSKSKFEGTV